MFIGGLFLGTARKTWFALASGIDELDSRHQRIDMGRADLRLGKAATETGFNSLLRCVDRPQGP